ncbi:MAG: alginate export family protein [Woeseiaceae bacterium]
MKKLLGMLIFLVATSVAAQEGETNSDFSTALTSGDFSLGLRARYEFVDQDGIDEDANATTTRLRLNYRTAKWHNWSAFVEFDHVFNILLTDYNSGGGTSPNKGDYPVIADPDGSDLNQMYFDYSSSPDWKWRLGRQRILLDNQRFVGGVGWRQNEQTFDAFSLTTTALGNTKLFYSYVGQVKRIFGETVPGGTNNVDSHLFNIKVDLGDSWAVTPYAYLIDNKDVTAFSTTTIGARIAGDLAVGEGKISLLGEFATQSDAGDAPVNYDADYSHFTATWVGASGLSIGIGFESLGGNPEEDSAFRTPLATLHAFNGWADKFLSTPDAGIKDTYVSAKVPVGKWKLTAVFHDFAAETGSGDHGTEIDLAAARKLSDRYSLLFKGAFFSADTASAYTDTDKFWVMLTANY